MIGALELGLLYGVMALGVYLTFRILNFAGLTVDGSFTTGGATAAVLLLAGWNPLLATLMGFVAGFAAGILTQIGLWSINLRIMGGANVPLLRQDTVFTPLREAGLMGNWGGVALLAVMVVLLGLVMYWFLTTDLGLAIRVTGDNGPMITSFGVSTDNTKILTLALSNGLVGACGGLVAQFQGFADISMGIGLIVVGLASVILGQAILGQRYVFQAIIAVIVGAVLYRVIIFFTLTVGLDPNDMKLVSAVLVVVALLVPFVSRIFKRLFPWHCQRAGGPRRGESRAERR
ncbi:ABC transporter permease [Corynebacterium cystitidis]|uniref:Putative ABC transport system permease protein n=1 Tax=Corynebacterium cystitidis DSM 20524 TaxID=1121357 RepID=A0A1H9PWW0_9CORY|nr:ABC transporter permease [Corynebacterium cystitidis]WJY82369.1 Branched-chain amino acid transport system / permease component [Corynebacterium cystitidis DSM 20524]SER52093.1 putative ABC transport system permease protein [Corynebacterium cystitidis DSM 20524]SNV76163.1 ABC transporter permease [Corynebacterium cystitidis]